MVEHTSDVESPAGQKVFVKRHIDEPLKIGDTWYILNSKWFSQWKQYVHYNADNDDEPIIDATHPGPINNAPILDSKGIMSDRALLEGQDYDTVPAIVWDKLMEWYSLCDPSHSLPRPVIEHGQFVKDCKVEVYPIELLLAHHKNLDNPSTEYVSGTKTIAQLIEYMKKMYEIPAEESVQLQHQYMGSTFQALKQPDDTLAVAGLHPRQLIVIVQKVDGKFPSINTYRSMKTDMWKSGPEKTGASNYSTTDSSKDPARSSSSSSSYKSASGDSSYFSNGYSYSSRSNSKPESGLCGLNNLGNTCFMNSALQCLSNVPALKKFFTNVDLVDHDLNTKNPLGMKGKLAQAYADLMDEMWNGKNSSTAPRTFKHAVGQFAPRFSGYSQQDAQELMAFLLDGLHEDLNRIKKKPYVETNERGNRPDEEVAVEAWHNYRLRNDSIIIDTFHGLLKSTLVCPNCKSISVTFDPFCYLSLPLPTKKDRIMVFHFVPKNINSQPLKAKVKVPKQGRIRDFCKAVEKLLNIASNKLLVVEIYKEQFQKVFEEDVRLNTIYESADLYVYERHDEGKDFIEAMVYIKQQRAYGAATTLMKPRLHSLPNEETSYESLFSTMAAIYGIQGEQPMEQEDTTPDDKLLTDNAECTKDSMEICKSPKTTLNEPFIVKLVNQYGNYETEKLKPGETITFKASPALTFIVLEFDKDTNTENIKHGFELPTDHDSLSQWEQKTAVMQLTDCVKLFTAEETLSAEDTWYCSKCKDHVEADKKFDLWNLPDYLVIHLKRFTYSTYLRNKIDTFINYPIRDLDLSDFVIGDQSSCKYDLIAVTNHFGSLGGGHYTAYAKNHLNGKWYNFDDSSVSEMGESSAVSKSGYVLVYAKQKLAEPANGVHND